MLAGVQLAGENAVIDLRQSRAVAGRAVPRLDPGDRRAASGGNPGIDALDIGAQFLNQFVAFRTAHFQTVLGPLEHRALLDGPPGRLRFDRGLFALHLDELLLASFDLFHQPEDLVLGLPDAVGDPVDLGQQRGVLDVGLDHGRLTLELDPLLLVVLELSFERAPLLFRGFQRFARRHDPLARLPRLSFEPADDAGQARALMPQRSDLLYAVRQQRQIGIGTGHRAPSVCAGALRVNDRSRRALERRSGSAPKVRTAAA